MLLTIIIVGYSVVFVTVVAWVGEIVVTHRHFQALLRQPLATGRSTR